MNIVRGMFLLSLLVPTLLLAQPKTYEKAMKVYLRKHNREMSKYLRKNPSCRENILLKSEELYDRKEFEQVVNLLKDFDDLEAEYRVILGLSLYETSQYDEARKVFLSLLNEEDQEQDVVYCNLGATYFNMEKGDSAIYYAQKSVELKPDEGLYRFNLGLGYWANDESDKACGQLFLASKLGDEDAPEWYESENCESWKEQWLAQLSGDDLLAVSNTMFPVIKDDLIVQHRTYLFEEAGKTQSLELVELKELPVGFLFKFRDGNGKTIVRWSDNGNKEWTLKGVRKFDETAFR